MAVSRLTTEYVPLYIPIYVNLDQHENVWIPKIGVREDSSWKCAGGEKTTFPSARSRSCQSINWRLAKVSVARRASSREHVDCSRPLTWCKSKHSETFSCRSNSRDHRASSVKVLWQNGDSWEKAKAVSQTCDGKSKTIERTTSSLMPEECIQRSGIFVFIFKMISSGSPEIHSGK